MNPIHSIIQMQKQFHKDGQTKNIDFRIQQLRKLKSMIIENEKEIMEALKTDLNKSEFESYTTEIGFVLSEITFTLKNIRKWTKPTRVKSSFTHIGSKGYVYKEPYGVALIIAPWNYPINLALAPLIGAIAAGNCAILKPSELTPATSSLINKLISKYFPQEYIAVIEGDAHTSQLLLNEDVDYIFFTGSIHVGKKVMEAAAKHLTPVTLELGGKSPCIVHHDAKLPLAAKRIVWGKLLNAGQTCVAPDYLLIHESIKDLFIEEMKKAMTELYGNEILDNPNYTKIVNNNHFNRLTQMVNRSKGRIRTGGKWEEDSLKIEPTLIESIHWNDPTMEEEIFGPVLPIITYHDIDEMIQQVSERPKPLALYLFTENNRISKKIIEEISFGSSCINDTVYQIATPHLPFGGVGASGTGAYHGKKSFDEFSHEKSVLKQTTRFDIPLRYPNVKKGLELVRKIMK
ncbi:aldehyde dehydrogenase [Heyndrickxia oleronia]|uniref:aldehyde dehydrogenase n=1 Tax=Heyndrickxia oleronia TaxID=38875 RepID=UPI001B1941D2|nr:aldehyde dehydrogenase [Heyndrickxia oleronia]GIN38016.1 aldehyde dehydrogenase [Heyndrickxia oleronia]